MMTTTMAATIGAIINKIMKIALLLPMLFRVVS